MALSNEEINRQISSSIEPMPPASAIVQESPLKAWTGQQRCTAGRWEYTWHPHNWRTDEAANARLLDMLLAEGFSLIPQRSTPDGPVVAIGAVGDLDGLGRRPYGFHSDRKACVRAAYCKWKGIE